VFGFIKQFLANPFNGVLAVYVYFVLASQIFSVLPAVIVGISLVSTQLKGYGNTDL